MNVMKIIEAKKAARLLMLAGLCLPPLLSAGPAARAADERKIHIGTASTTGVYHAAGHSICQVVNRARDNGLYCVVQGTNGTVENIKRVRAGRLEFGVAQSDWQSRAHRGAGMFRAHGAFRDLRTALALHAEPFTLLAHPEAGIAAFGDLRGKRVNVGVRGSARRATMEALMAAFGMRLGDFAAATEHKNGYRIAKALCGGELDAAVYSIGHPNEEAQAAVDQCGAQLVEISGPPVERLLSDHPIYRRAVIPGGLYAGNPRDTRTFGAVATLITTADMPEEVVYEITRAVYEGLDSIRNKHPAFAELRARDLAEFDGAAPVHPGAARFFAERGMR